ncbi:hypothetical protein RJ640_013570 [Escallonia rubra]|uniref:Uncharacterized protein n=1 Tax=Escallonia rubra TaxID=112253 RepID=A0AA88U3C6_9ASTE|nr:hypothetical protein RJ640_013570 [Escallonia rubra]
MSNVYLQGLLPKLRLYIHYYNLLVQAHHGHSLPFKHHRLPSSTTASYHFIVMKVLSTPSPLHSEWPLPALGVAKFVRGDRLTAFNTVFSRQVAVRIWNITNLDNFRAKKLQPYLERTLLSRFGGEYTEIVHILSP